jgi:predicted RNase H-like HicB family nuclease
VVSEYAVIYEQGSTSWGAWVPDLPGCVAAGGSRGEVETLIAEAIGAHIESLREHGEPAARAVLDGRRGPSPRRLRQRPSRLAATTQV